MQYGYCRCSTNETKQEINRQVSELIKMGVKKQNIYKEYISGTAECKTELNKILAIIDAGDTLCCTEVSRITRSTRQLCNLVEFAKNKKLKLVLGTFVLDCTEKLDPMAEGMLKMMGVFAELERNIISERVRSGMKYAKSKGKKIGRPKKTDVPKKIKEYASLLETGKINKKDLAVLCGVSRPTLDKYLKMLNK